MPAPSWFGNLVYPDASVKRGDVHRAVNALAGKPKPSLGMFGAPPPTNALATPGASIKATPHSIADTVQSAARNALIALGMSKYGADMGADRVFNFLNDLTPVGSAVSAQQAGRDYRSGNYLGAVGNGAIAALGAIPEGRAIERGAARHLGLPSRLFTPRTPTAEEMASLAQIQRVPLSQARHGNQLEWGRFNSGQHGEPLVPGYSDKPLAVQLENGEFVLLDGNHRASLAAGRGESNMPMYVIPAKRYDPANAGTSPVPYTTQEIDRLLSELRR